jgi:hypothetical protein
MRCQDRLLVSNDTKDIKEKLDQFQSDTFDSLHGKD